MKLYIYIFFMFMLLLGNALYDFKLCCYQQELEEKAVTIDGYADVEPYSEEALMYMNVHVSCWDWIASDFFLNVDWTVFFVC